MKNTKKALMLSCISMLLCISMLVGSTFAWFTDTASTGVNIIKAGNLDLVLEYLNDDGDWEEVTKNTLLFDPLALYEPGYTEVAYLRIRNNGSLALKYILNVDVADEVAGKNKEGESILLSEHLKFGVITTEVGQKVTIFDTREAAMKAVENDAKNLQSYSTEKYVALAPTEAIEMALVVYMPTTVGNEANHNGVDIPTITMGVNVFATQKDYEKDSYGPDYDKDAIYPAAYIKDVAYETLQDALNAAANGDTIVLNRDIVAPGYVVVPEGKEVIIDGKGYTYRFYEDNAFQGADHVAQMGKNTKLTIRDTKFVSQSANTGFVAVTGFESTGSAVVLDGCTFVDLWGAVYVNNTTGYGSVTIKNCKYENCDWLYGDENKYYANGKDADQYYTINFTGNTYPEGMTEEWWGQAAIIDDINAIGYATLDDAIKAADNDEPITLKAGTHDLNNVSLTNKTLTITGAKDAIIDMTGYKSEMGSTHGATLTFDGVTVNWLAVESYQGFAHVNKLTYKNCDINGLQYLYGETVFEDCTFSNEQCWSVWTYSSENVKFTRCTFNTGGHAVLVYNELYSTGFENNVSFNKCTFENAGTVSEPWGHEDLVETSMVNPATNTNKYNLTFTDCTVTGSDKQKMWGNKNSLTPDQLTVTINGKVAVEKTAGTADDLKTVFEEAFKNGGNEDITITLTQDIVIGDNG